MNLQDIDKRFDALHGYLDYVINLKLGFYEQDGHWLDLDRISGIYNLKARGRSVMLPTTFDGWLWLEKMFYLVPGHEECVTLVEKAMKRLDIKGKGIFEPFDDGNCRDWVDQYYMPDDAGLKRFFIPAYPQQNVDKWGALTDNRLSQREFADLYLQKPKRRE